MAGIATKLNKKQKIRKYGEESRFYNDPYWVLRQILREWRENVTETLPDRSYGLIVAKDTNYIQESTSDSILDFNSFFNFNKPITVFKVVPLDRTIEIEPENVLDEEKIASMGWYLPEDSEAMEKCLACDIGDIIVINAPDKSRTSTQSEHLYTYKSPFLSTANSAALTAVAQVADDAKKKFDKSAFGKKANAIFSSLFRDKTKKLTTPEKTRIIFAFQTLKDSLPQLNDTQVAGIVGNLIVESGLNPSISNPSDPNGGSFGIAQWLNGKDPKNIDSQRKTNLIKFAGARNKPIDDLETQLLYLAQELIGLEKKALFKLTLTNTIDPGNLQSTEGSPPGSKSLNSAVNFRANFERAAFATAHDDLRSTYAQQALSIYSSKDTKSDFPEVASNDNYQTKKEKVARSEPRNYPFLEFVSLEADFSRANKLTADQGNKFFSVREDLVTPIKKIKSVMNQYGIAFTIDSIDFNANTKNISYLQRVGMQIALNKNSGLNPDGNIIFDEYLVSPDEKNTFSNFIFPYIVWGRIKSNIKEAIGDEKIFEGELKVLDVTESYKVNSPPKIKKINGRFLNLTDLFIQNGFSPILGKKEFYLNSNVTLSNWNIFEYHEGLVSNVTTYGELLSKSYKNNGEQTWNDSNKIWNGKQFIG